MHHAAFPVGHHLPEQLEESRIVVTVPGVAKLVNRYALDARAGGVYQLDVRCHGSGARQAAPAGLHRPHSQAWMLDTFEVGQVEIQDLSEYGSCAVETSATQQPARKIKLLCSSDQDSDIAAAISSSP